MVNVLQQDNAVGRYNVYKVTILVKHWHSNICESADSRWLTGLSLLLQDINQNTDI